MKEIVYAMVIVILALTYLFDLWISLLNYRNRNAKIPQEVEDVYDQETYQKWLSYMMENYRIGLIQKSLNIIILLSFLVFGVFRWIGDTVEVATNNFFLQTFAFLSFYFIVEFLIGIGFSYYKQFSIEARYGFNKTTKKTFVLDKIKGILLFILLGGGFIYLLTLLYTKVHNLFYILAWASIIVIILVVNLLYTKLIVPIFNKLTPLEEGSLKDKIIEFAKSVGYEVTKISVMNASKRSTKLNAFFSGFGKMKQVVLYDTLIKKMTENQIVSVLAHEIGHAKHKDIIKNLLFTTLVLTVYIFVLWICLNSVVLHEAFGFGAVHFGFGLILFSIFISPIDRVLDIPLTFFSRKAEYAADKYAADNGYPAAMIEALKELGRSNYANLTPHPVYVKMTYSHPPIGDRIRAIQKGM